MVCFSVDDFNEAYEVAQQLFKYDPQQAKLPPAHQSGQPILELDRGQFLTAANWLQHLKHRECILKRYLSEAEEDPFVTYIEQTGEMPNQPLGGSLMAIKQGLLMRRAIPIRDALQAVNQRELTNKTVKRRPTIDP